jgi:hypothetical protein
MAGAISKESISTAGAALKVVKSKETTSDATRQERFDSQGWDAMKASPFYDLLREYQDVFPEEVPCELPSDKGVRHEIDLEPGSKYCVTRQ